MTKEQIIKRKVALAVGLTVTRARGAFELRERDGSTSKFTRFTSTKKHPTLADALDILPDFTGSLAVMHMAEKTMDSAQADRYARELEKMCRKSKHRKFPASRYAWHATAMQRALLFIKATAKT